MIELIVAIVIIVIIVNIVIAIIRNDSQMVLRIFQNVEITSTMFG